MAFDLMMPKMIEYNFLGEITDIKAIVRHIGKNTYCLSCWKLNEKIDNTLVSVQ